MLTMYYLAIVLLNRQDIFTKIKVSLSFCGASLCESFAMHLMWGGGERRSLVNHDEVNIIFARKKKYKYSKFNIS